MILLPVSVVDGFFDEPDQIRNYALGLTSEPDSEGKWPGSRTANLAEINPKLFDHTCRRIASLFWDTRDPNEFVQWQAQGGFQLVDSSYQSGWVHHDAGEELFTAIIYLTPNASTSTGTSIWELKDRIVPIPTAAKEAKFPALRQELDATTATLARQELNNYYTESIRVNNKYNRAIIFDSHLYHAAGEFDTLTEDRLTLTIFFSKLGSSKLSPIQRLKREID
jgi:hypothetical protein